MKIPFSPPDITEAEIERVSEALRSGWITTGPVTKRLERGIAGFCGASRAACLSSATAAMELSLRILGVGPGDEVITSAYTYTASASVIAHVGAKVVLADSVPGGFLIDPADVERKINGRTKAVIPVDVGGIPADYDGIGAAISRKKPLFSPGTRRQEQLARIAVVGDAAHSLGAVYRGRPAAQWADFCCFSFHAVKNFTTAEGGAVCFEDIGDVSAEELYKQFMLMSLHGQSRDALAKTQLGGWEYDIVIPGYKCNMTDILAAVGEVQLERYPELLRRRREIFGRYDEWFDGTRVRAPKQRTVEYEGSYHAYITRIEGLTEPGRGELIERMRERGISLNVHYKPLPMMTAYRDMGFDIRDFPNARSYYSSEVTLPSFSRMTDDEVDRVAETMLELLASPEFSNA